jgi:PAS domain-containing protein
MSHRKAQSRQGRAGGPQPGDALAPIGPWRPWRTLGLVLAVLAGLATPPASAAESLTLLLRWDHQFQFAGYYAALWKGYYQDAGLDVTIRTPFKGKSVLNSIDEVMSGAADFGIGGADLLIARDKGIPVVVLGTIFQDSAAEFYINRRSGYSSLADLSHLRVARRTGDLLDIEFQAMLKAEGLNPDMVKPIASYGSEQALADGSLDLSPGYSFVTPYILKELGVDFVALRPHGYGVHFYGDSLFTRQGFIDRKEDAVNKFVTASLRGWQYALENPEEIADLIAEKLTRRFPVNDPRAFNRAQIEGVRKLTLYPIVEPGHINPGRWRHMHDWLGKIGLVTGPLDIDRFIFNPRQRELERQKILIKGGLALGGLGAALGVVLWIWLLRRTVTARTRELTDEITERKRVEVALAEKSVLETSLESMSQGIVVFDGDLKLVAFNRYYVDLMDCPPGCIRQGVSYEEISRFKAQRGDYGAGDPDKYVQKRVRARREGKPNYRERTLANGRVIVTRRDPLPDGGYVSTYTDITDRKKAEQEVARKSALLETTLESMSQGIVAFDGDLKVVAFNQNYLDFCRYPPDFIRLGTNYKEIVRAKAKRGDYGPVTDIEGLVGERIAARRMGDKVVRRERTLPDGKVIAVNREPMPDGGYVTTLTDITERKKAEQEVATKSILLETTFESMNQGIIVTDSGPRVLAFNQKYADFIDFPPGFLNPGMSFEKVLRFQAERGDFGAGDVEEIVRQRLLARQQGKMHRRERILRDGRVIAISREAMPGGGHVTTFTDITERQRAEEEIAGKSALLETTFENMNQGIRVVDADLKLVAFNQRWADLWAYPAGFLRLGMPYEEIARFNAERGIYGPIDVKDHVDKRMQERRRNKAVRREIKLPNGLIVTGNHEPMPGGGNVSTYTDITERKRAEEEIAEKSALLGATFESMSQGIVAYDDDLKLIAFNQTYIDLLGLPPGFVRPGMSYEDLFRYNAQRGDYGPGDVEELVKERIDLARQGVAIGIERTRPNGTVLGIRRDPLPDGGCVVTYTDITERKRAEEEIAEKSALLETTFENMNQGIRVLDADLKLVAFNQRFIDLWRYPPGFIRVGMSLEDIVRFKAERGDHGPGDVDEYVRERLSAKRNRRNARRETVLPNGEVIAAYHEAMPGSGYVTTYTDITEIKRAEEAVRESEARLVNAQRIARLGNWDRDIATGEVHWSDQVYDLFAVAPGQFARTYEAFLDRIHPDDRELVVEAGRKALDENAPIDVEYRIVHPDTSERIIHSHGEAEFDAAGKPVRLSGTVQDITERKSLEERIRQIQKLDAVGKLAGGVAHEFNNLLFVIKGNSDLLEARLNGDPELRRYVELISRQTERGSYLTRLLVAYARNQPLRPKKMDINSIVRQTAKLLEGSLSDAIEIDVVCAKNLWQTMVDRNELESVIVNLAVNAQDAMPEGGKLIVETANVCVDGESTAHGDDASSDEYVKLAVTDTGCGMAAVIVERAFEPFFTTKEVGKGTGLGLSMVYGFVNQSGGYVTIDSEIARGTTVSVYLPKAMGAST